MPDVFYLDPAKLNQIVVETGKHQDSLDLLNKQVMDTGQQIARNMDADAGAVVYTLLEEWSSDYNSLLKDLALLNEKVNAMGIAQQQHANDGAQAAQGGGW